MSRIGITSSVIQFYSVQMLTIDIDYETTFLFRTCWGFYINAVDLKLWYNIK